MRTAVVILNWNTRNYLSDFLPNLILSCEGNDAEIVVADNGSIDGTIDFLKKEYSTVKTIALDKNYGFTGGYNKAIQIVAKEYNPEYIVLINSDILVEKDWLKPLIAFMDTHQQCGVCGSKLLSLQKQNGIYIKTRRFEYAGAAGGYLDKYGFPFCRGRILQQCEEDKGQYDNEKQVFWVSGACLMTRTKLWLELGGLDERFFAHQEEIDFCWRVQRFGYEIWSVPKSEVYHLGGGTLNNSSAFKLELNYRNSLWMLAKNLPSVLSKSQSIRRLRFRLLIDDLTAIVYLLTAKFKSFQAVINAHRAFRHSGGLSLVEDCKKTSIAGIQNICIILQRNRAKFL